MTPTPVASRLLEEALNLMHGKGAILESARELSGGMQRAGLAAPVIGGVAVVLHGHRRSSRGIDLLAVSSTESVAEVLESHGFQPGPSQHAFIRDEIPVHLVDPERAGTDDPGMIEIEGIVAVDLASLINMKLRSGSTNLLRAQDLADVIGLIRHHHLTGEFARQLDRSLRPTFRKLVRAIEQEG